ncbi:hypothetical protein DFH06DRAFT_1314555 [Mycena polygramma]|nr:hypothetical protein DFH06DRAFT_1314555 [Mycena polygramma]
MRPTKGVKGQDDDQPVKSKRRRVRGNAEPDDDVQQTTVAGPSSGVTPSTEQPRRKRARGNLEGIDMTAEAAVQMPARARTSLVATSLYESLSSAPEEPAPESLPVKKFGGLAGAQKRDVPQGASKAINAARPHFDTTQAAILAGFAHKDIGKPCGCNADSKETLYRCKECFKPKISCRTCIIRKHVDTPFHRVERWNGKHFSDVSWGPDEREPHELEPDEQGPKLVLHTCPNVDGAQRCPQVTDQYLQSQMTTVGHHNGFHTLEVQFCACTAQQGAKLVPHFKQLLNVRLFPATYTSPKTVFTWTVMKEFHIHCLASKKSPYDYIKALYKLTDNAFAPDVADRYREFLFAFRLWRRHALVRRTGQAHGFDRFVPHRQAGSLTMRCPLCPEVGFNMSKETMEAALESEQHKFTLAVSVDGNFKLQRKNKRDDPDDVALNEGNAYFTETGEFKRYVSVVKPSPDLSTCSHLRAARMQNIAKFKNAVISGVVAVQCARHGFYLPQGMVDLKKGEAFALTDYALMQSLAEATPQRFILVTYDIWCQYVVNLETRITNWFPSMLPILEKIHGAIPKMHILNHIELCQILWNLSWMLYSAFTVGEMIETGWAEHNLTAGSTKEQNDGNRHDSIDDTSGNWNWDKTVRLATTLLRLWRVCKAEQRKRNADFEALTATHPPELIKEWEKGNVVSEMKDGKLISIFQTNFKKGPPTHAEAYAKLLKAEADLEAADEQSKMGDSALISTALLVERDQQQVKRMIATQAGDDLIGAARRRLYSAVTHLRSRLVARAPVLEKHIMDADPEKVEKEPLFLPSHFTETARSEMKLATLAQVEYTLREGQAFDALGDVRTAIRTLNFNLALKKTQIHGVGANTKSQNYLKTLSNDIQVAADSYRRARTALLALGLPSDDATLRELLKSDLFGKGGRKRAMGDAKLRDSWFWTTGRAANLTPAEEAEWEAEMDRVKWVHERAYRDRAVEEEETLVEEFKRGTAAFTRSGEIWTRIGDESLEAGAKAYAYKQATMYNKLAKGVRDAWERAPAEVAKDIIAEEIKRRKEREDEERKMKKYLAENAGSDDFSAYYETIEIVVPSGPRAG